MAPIAYPPATTAELAALFDWEQRRTVRSDWMQLQVVVPGLVQTPEYAEQMYRAHSYRGEAVVQGVAFRRLRQQWMHQGLGRNHFVVHESGLRLRAGDDNTVMVDQMRYLTELSALPYITLQVIPEAAGLYPGCVGDFTLLQNWDDLRVHQEGTKWHHVTDDAYFFAQLLAMFEEVANDWALSPEASLELIHRYMGAWQSGEVRTWP